MKDDKLSHHRSAKLRDEGRFFSWVKANCVHAKSHEEVRQITKKIDKPIGEVINDDK